MSEPKEIFDPIRGKLGEFRVALNLSELGDRAWELLSLAQGLEFESPRFVIDPKRQEIWAIILQQFHRYDADPMVVVEPWDVQLKELWDAVGENAMHKLMIVHNFEAYLEPQKAIA
jgi:hypothetical protein